MTKNHDQIYERLERIEEKLDKHLEEVTANRTDLKWVKGYVKTSVSAILAIIGTLITGYFKLFSDK